MSDTDPHFHQFALQSILFKGRADWYFCFLKSEKIAHVLAHLAGTGSGDAALALLELARGAAKLPESIVRFVAGELEQESALADVFALGSAVRFAASAGDLSAENAMLINAEYERIAQKLGTPGHLSPFISADDFSVPSLSAERRSLMSARTPGIKDKFNRLKGHATQPKGQQAAPASAGQVQAERVGKGERLAKILEVVRKRGGASIKDIAAEVKECGEKTIQRELATLIEEGLIRKEGERRWSIYKPVSGI